MILLQLIKHITLKKAKISAILKRKAKWRAYHISNTNILCAVQYNRIIMQYISIVLWNSAILLLFIRERSFQDWDHCWILSVIMLWNICNIFWIIFCAEFILVYIIIIHNCEIIFPRQFDILIISWNSFLWNNLISKVIYLFTWRMKF